jgi:hypothetical protein
LEGAYVKILDFVIPEQIQNECIASIKRLSNDSLFEFCRNKELAKYFGGIRPIPSNAGLLKSKILNLLPSGHDVIIYFLREASLYQRFTIVLSSEALTRGFTSLEKSFGSAPILLAMLLDSRESVREFAQEKCGQIIDWKIAPESQEEAQVAFKETFAPFINEISHLLNKPELQEVVREVKSELPPAEAKELSELRNEVKALRKVQSEAYSFANKLAQQQEKTARLEREKASILDNDRELRQQIKQLTGEIDRLRHEKRKLEQEVINNELKVNALNESKRKQKENYEQRLEQEQKNIFRQIYIEEAKQEEQNRNPVLEFFAQYNKFFNINTEAALIIDGHNVLNKDYYQSLDLSHEEIRMMLARALSKLFDFLPRLRIYLYFDSYSESTNNFGDERLIIKYSGGIGEHRADREIKKEYGRLLLAEEKFIFLVTDDNDIRDYCSEAGIISSEDLIRLIK